MSSSSPVKLFSIIGILIVELGECLPSNTTSTIEITTPIVEVTTVTIDDVIIEEIPYAPTIKPERNDDESGSDESLSQEWIDDAIRNVAFNLRCYKFSSFDRRYFTADMPNVTYGFYTGFPDPPLRNLHWEVHANCSVGFVKCLRYLNEKIEKTHHQRETDTATIVRMSHWQLPGNRDLITHVNNECLRLTGMDLDRNKPFQGPLEKFQWQTSASYYMCWYTMQDIPNLAMFGEPCDNFANCWDPEWGIAHADFRADDRIPYACALYSFCPDPCCPKKHARSPEECSNMTNSACSLQKDKTCTFDRTMNRDQISIIYNHWNVSCTCEREGFHWSSKYGMCLDVNECESEIQVCHNETETCLNLPGSYDCGCSFGFKWSDQSKSCVENAFLHESIARAIAHYTSQNAAKTEVERPLSLLDFLRKLVRYIRSKFFIIEWVILALT